MFFPLDGNVLLELDGNE